MRPLPKVNSLAQAVMEVITSNQKDGYNPSRFIQITKGGYDDDLFMVCNSLICIGTTLEWLENALKKHPDLLTLEDFVARYGSTWNFSSETMSIAKARACYFDQLTKHQRYS